MLLLTVGAKLPSYEAQIIVTLFLTAAVSAHKSSYIRDSIQEVFGNGGNLSELLQQNNWVGKHIRKKGVVAANELSWLG